jgi:hypothetical protein
MATPSRESVLDSAHWTMAVDVVRDFFVSMAEAIVRVPRYMGTRKNSLWGGMPSPKLHFAIMVSTSRLQ